MTHPRKLAALALFLLILAFVWGNRQAQEAARLQIINAKFLDAVRVNDVPAAARFLDAGADPNARRDYYLPLTQRLSLVLRHPEMRRILFDSGYGRPRLSPGPLWHARVFHHRSMVALLLARGANPNVSFYGVPPLLDIIRQGDTVMLQTFLDGGANVNVCDAQKGTTALMSAASRGRMRDVRLLLDRGASVNLTDKAGKTALTLAQENKRAEAVKLLTAAGGTH